MDKQHQSTQEIRCTVCADPCTDQHHGRLCGTLQADSGDRERYLVHLCNGCFSGALRYLRQEYDVLNLFQDQQPLSDSTFGLIIEPTPQAKI